MKKVPIFTITAILSLMFGITACGEKVSNNLGGATRGNNAYDYNYDYSGMRTDGENMLNRFGINNTNGAGYWDYYGITNGSANDSMRNDIADTNNYNNYNASAPTAPLLQGTSYNASLDSATVAN